MCHEQRLLIRCYGLQHAWMRPQAGNRATNRRGPCCQHTIGEDPDQLSSPASGNTDTTTQPATSISSRLPDLLQLLATGSARQAWLSAITGELSKRTRTTGDHMGTELLSPSWRACSSPVVAMISCVIVCYCCVSSVPCRFYTGNRSPGPRYRPTWTRPRDSSTAGSPTRCSGTTSE